MKTSILFNKCWKSFEINLAVQLAHLVEQWLFTAAFLAQLPVLECVMPIVAMLTKLRVVSPMSLIHTLVSSTNTEHTFLPEHTDNAQVHVYSVGHYVCVCTH